MPVGEGGFVWYELMTNEADASREFYARVVGWRAADAGMPGISYTILKVGERPVAGMMGTAPQGRQPPPSWVGHILVADVDAMAERVVNAGGIVRRPPFDIPGVGRFAVVADPQGAAFMLFRADGTPAPPLAPATPGDIGWHELHAHRWEAAFAFYQDLFGWEKSEAVDIGPMGIYQTFTVGGISAGGMMNDPRAAAPFWLYYFNVEEIDAAASRITGAGGTLVQGPRQVPGGSWIIQATDPEGAMFAVVGPRIEAALP